MDDPIEISRRQALRYRFVAHGLDRQTDHPADLDVLDLGVQDTNVGSARTALAARLPKTASAELLDNPAYTLAWTFRGAPHLHRTADIGRLAPALWPVSDADAMARLAAERAPLKAAGIPGRNAFRAAAEAMREVVTAPMVKGEVSAGMTARLPDAYSKWCEPCRSTHIYGGLFQLVGVLAGVGLVPGRTPAVLIPLPDRPPIPDVSAGSANLVRSYLRLHGPARPADAAGYLGTTATALAPAWPDDLVEVQVDGRQTWFPPDRLDLLVGAAPHPGTVRLLPPADPYLQGRDRDVLVPDKARQKVVWRMTGNPGAVLVEGEVVGVWRVRSRPKRRIELVVESFDALAPEVRTAVGTEADRVAELRGAGGVDVRYNAD